MTKYSDSAALAQRIREVNAFIAERNLCEWELAGLERYTLTVHGSFDLGYYHEIALVFREVAYVDCAANWSWPDKGHVSLSLTEDLSLLRRIYGQADEGSRLFTIHADGERPFRIVAYDLAASFELVKHYVE